MVKWLKPWYLLPPKLAHDLSPLALRLYGKIKPYQTLTWRPFVWRDLEFTNPMGIAGGVDKNAKSVPDWWTLGAGFVEIGTVTPKPQGPNPGSIIQRDIAKKAIWNKMGFPNLGVDAAIKNLKPLYQPRFTPVFANIGKNRSTPNERAHEDYITCIHKLTPYIDAFVINISSPNTSGLRELLKPENLRNFLSPIINANKIASDDYRRKTDSSEVVLTPLLLKLSPDISNMELEQIVEISIELGIDGWILTNTTTSRQGVRFPKEGGVSGAPLTDISKEMLKKLVALTQDCKSQKLIVSAGGILTAEEVFERLEIGADLVQVYAALIFKGPFFFREVADKAHTLGLS